MAIVTTDNQHYTDIATATRSKNGTETLYKPSEMADANQAISGGGEPEPPDDGKTRLYITVPASAMPDRPPPRNQVPLYIQQTVANGVTIDWGDGTAVETLPGTGKVNTTHTYEQAGDYVISLEPAEGCELDFGNGSSSYCVMGETFRGYSNILRKVYIGKNVRSIANYAFQDCLCLSSVFFHDSPTAFWPEAFNRCPIESIIIPSKVTKIYDSCFEFCTSLLSVVIGERVEDIYDRAFEQCRNLKDVYLYPISPPAIRTGTFSNVPSDCTYHVRPKSLETYKLATNWTTIADQIVGDLKV